MSIYAINLGNGIYKFRGLSTDTKGTGSLVDANGLTIKYEVTSEFTEIDTGHSYKYNGSTAGWDRTGSSGSAKSDISFIPSSYTGNVSATTTVTGQSVAIATGASKLRVRNLDATNYGLVAFGTSAANAESNAANGCAVEFGQVEIIGIPQDATHFAYLGDTGTVVLNVQQGI